MSEKVSLDSEQGKQTIDSLLAKMSPERQEEFKKALNGDKPVHVQVDKEGNVVFGTDLAEVAADGQVLPPAPEEPVELKKDEPRKMSKIDEKRQRILMERLQRKMGSGMSREQAIMAIQKEDFDALPLDKKFARLESVVANSLRGLSQEVMNLSQGHMAIADAFDINYRAIQKLFTKLGVTPEEQKAFIEESQKEVIEERKKIIETRQAQMQAERDAAEKARMEAEAKPAEKQVAEPAPEGSEIPKEATVFG